MTLQEDIRVSLRITSSDFDSEVRMLIDAARFDMERVGIDPTLLALDPETQDLENAFVKAAVTAYCKAHFGFDNAEAVRLDDSYRRIVCDLLNSASNIAAIAEQDDSGESDAGDGSALGASYSGDGAEG